MRLEELRRAARVRQELRDGTARARRRRLGATAAEAGAVVGVVGSTIVRWELGSRRPSTEHALAYGRLLDALDDEG